MDNPNCEVHYMPPELVVVWKPIPVVRRRRTKKRKKRWPFAIATVMTVALTVALVLS